ncbi:ion transporter [Haloarchaeobius amylolyticus]|uniref:ion transporter n=1 Tax=Haloarchaeobius amylolyticus TaxID=1198296 RepID=UPI0022722D63|nr:ion transporter [Haloarchaeobius amylolyticus]
MQNRDVRPPDGGPRELVEFYLLDHRTTLGKVIDIALMALNLCFVGIFVFETYSVSAETRQLLWAAEVAIACVFALEYVLRLYGAPDRFEEATDVYTVVDLLAILPTFAFLLVPGLSVFALDIGFLRALRVVRFMRFYRFTRDEEFFFGSISVHELRVLKLLLTVLTIFFVSAGVFYAAEHVANPEVANFGDAFYFTVVTLTTVGFGDIVPLTAGGRIVTTGAIISGVVLIPWQASRIVREWTTDKVSVTCESCGLAYHDPDASHCKACGHVIYQEYDSR